MTAGATLFLTGILGVAAVPAGAQSSIVRNARSSTAATATAIVPGTYVWYVDGSAAGSITLESNSGFTSTMADDSGDWVQAGKTVALAIWRGSDGGGGCVYAGDVNSTGTAIGSPTNPGTWDCPYYPSSGTFYLVPAAANASATHVHSDPFARSDTSGATVGTFKPGTYLWIEWLDIGSKDRSTLKTAKNHTYTSTLDKNDSGTWVQGGSAIALTIRAGEDGEGGCVYVGRVNSNGTVATIARPGNWICPGYGSSGYFAVS
jgi:hypothetical protein